MSAINKLPLHGVKILDLTRVLAGKTRVLFQNGIISISFKDLLPV